MSIKSTEGGTSLVSAPLDAPGSSQKRSFSVFRNFKIGARIYLGFAIVLCLLAGLTIYGNSKLTGLEGRIIFYGDKAGDALLLSDMQRAVTEVQLAAREYVGTSSPD